MDFLLLAPGSGQGDLWFVIPLFLAVFFASSMISARVMGIFGLYRDFPADPSDPIEANLGWQQVEFGTFRGHTPMSFKIGKRFLHLKQPFPFQLLFWKGPASIPWDVLILEKAPKEAWWAFLSAAQFRLGPGGRVLRLRGRAAKAVMAKVKGSQGEPGPGPTMPGPGSIRPN
jgi:hypothetical protein